MKAGRSALLSPTQAVGAERESEAETFFINKGWVLSARNYRTPLGEVDLIFREPDGTVVFVEVKYRTRSDYGSASEMVSVSKQRKVVKAALAFIKREKLHRQCFRFDVAALSPSGLLHIPNAFSPQGYTF